MKKIERPYYGASATVNGGQSKQIAYLVRSKTSMPEKKTIGVWGASCNGGQQNQSQNNKITMAHSPGGDCYGGVLSKMFRAEASPIFPGEKAFMFTNVVRCF